MTAFEMLNGTRADALAKSPHWREKVNQYQVAAEFGIPAARLAELRGTGGGPAFTHSACIATYRRADVQAWAEANEGGASA